MEKHFEVPESNENKNKDFKAHLQPVCQKT